MNHGVIIGSHLWHARMSASGADTLEDMSQINGMLPYVLSLTRRGGYWLNECGHVRGNRITGFSIQLTHPPHISVLCVSFDQTRVD